MSVKKVRKLYIENIKKNRFCNSSNHFADIDSCKGKRSVDWKNVREYLKEYVGEFYKITATDDIVYIGADLPRDYVEAYFVK